MAYAVCLVLDEAGSAKVEHLWLQLANAGIADDMVALGYPPHITLLVTQDEIDEPDTIARFGALAVEAVELIWFTGLGIFPNDPFAVLWLTPAAHSGMSVLHEHLSSHLNWQLDTHYAMPHWTPHCTLSSAVEKSKLQDALRLAATNFAPFSCHAARIDLVQFTPVHILHSKNLGGD